MLFLMSFIIGSQKGKIIVFLNTIFALAMIGSLILFYFKRNNIENFAFFTQIIIVLLTSTKVYLMGGIFQGIGAIFVGLLGPFYALILPNKRRAIILFILYLVLIAFATFLNPINNDNYLLDYHFLGFVLSVVMIFSMLFYFTSRLEKLKKEEKIRLIELDRLKTNFFTQVAHELRTPLTIILGKSNQLKKRVGGFEQDFQMIERNGIHLLKMSQQLLDLSKLEANSMSVNLEQQDMVLYLRYLLESFHPMLNDKNIELIFNSENSQLFMDFDEEKLRIIVSNLITNAIKHTRANGKIYVNFYQKKDDINRVYFEVKDEGSGIPKQFQHRVFDRFFQLENNEEIYGSNGGNGLGLFLTKELLKLCGGDIILESELGKGSIFRFWLPATFNSKMKSETQPLKDENSIIERNSEIHESQLVSKDNKHRLHLLIIEDNDDVIDYLKSILIDYEIKTAKNGIEGMELAKNNIPDLIISDVMMPQEDGISFCKKIKNDFLTSHIPVILLTAKVDHKSKLEGINAGADVYLPKPFDAQELLLRIKQITSLRKVLQKRYSKMVNGLLPDHLENLTFIHEDKFMENVIQIIENHLDDENFSVDLLSSEISMSRSQLYRKFSALTDKTVHQFIRKYKLNRSRQLLKNTDLNVSQVAMDTGFKNLSHFSRIYSEEFGYSPQMEKKIIKPNSPISLN